MFYASNLQFKREDGRLPLLFLYEIGLIDLSKSGGAMAPSAPPGTTPLRIELTNFNLRSSDAYLVLSYLIATVIYREFAVFSPSFL